MLNRTGIAFASLQVGGLSFSARATRTSAINSNMTATLPLFQRNRLFSSTRTIAGEQQLAREPRPIPLDIGNGPSVSTAPSAGPSLQASGAEAALESNVARRTYRSSYSNGSFLDRFGGPIFSVLVYSTAATLVMHNMYHHLALEEYRIASSRKVAELEAEIAEIKAQQSSNTVQHSLGGRHEFI
ncbi:hypothetical protein BX616_002455 [Lobosporangium transversale]|nr:hypothetical protein BX616_002455 [Lobosporangium transversale]